VQAQAVSSRNEAAEDRRPAVGGRTESDAVANCSADTNELSFFFLQHLFTYILSFMDGAVEESLRLVTGMNHGEKSRFALHTMLRQPVVWKDLCTDLAHLRNTGYAVLCERFPMGGSQDCKL
jgi:hypothetical protein